MKSPSLVKKMFWFASAMAIAKASILQFNSLLGYEENEKLNSFLQKWLGHSYTTWPVISKADKSHLVISACSQQESAILQQLELSFKPVITGVLSKELRKRQELLHALTIVTSVLGATSSLEISSILQRTSKIGWKRKDNFLFICSSTSTLLAKVYGSDVVKSLKHRIGYATDTSTVFIDPHVYNRGIPIAVSLSENPTPKSRMGYALQGRHLRIAGCVELLPYHYLRTSKHSKIPEQAGSQYQLVETTSKKFNFTFEIHFEIGAGYGNLLENGTWTGMIGNLIYPEKNFDFAILFGHLYHFYDKFDFVGAVSCSTIRFFQARPNIEEQVSWKSLFAPFKWNVWVFIVISYVVFSLAMWKVFQKFDDDTGTSSVAQFYNGCIITYKIALEQSVPLASDGIRKIAVSWFLLTLITSTAYRTVMISFLTFPSYPEVPLTWADLASAEDYNIMLLRTGDVETVYFQESSNPTIQRINSNLQIIEQEHGKDCFYGALFHERVVCISWFPDVVSRFYNAGIINRFNLKEEPYLISKDAAFFTSATIPFQKDSIYTDSFTPVVEALVSSGLYFKWMDDAFLGFKEKSLENSDELAKDTVYGEEYKNGLQRLEKSGTFGEEERPLKISNLLVVFLVLAVGLITSFLAIVGEVGKLHYLHLKDCISRLKSPNYWISLSLGLGSSFGGRKNNKEDKRASSSLSNIVPVKQ